MKLTFLQTILGLRGGSDFEPSAPADFTTTVRIGNVTALPTVTCRVGCCGSGGGVDFTQSSSQREQRPLKANSQAWMCARMLLQGYEFTVQDVVKEFAKKGIVSNEPGRRIREAVAWLKKEGVPVRFKLVGGNPKHKRWFVEVNGDCEQEALTALRKLFVKR